MTRKAGYPLQGTRARGGAGSDVVEVRSALPPTAVHAPSLVDYPLDKAPGARGGADSDVVEVRSALPLPAVHAPSLVSFRAGCGCCTACPYA